PASRRPDGAGRIHEVSPEAMERLPAYRFPGNVRELGNVLERAVSLAGGVVIDARDLPEMVRGEHAASPGGPRPAGAPPPVPSEIADSTFKEAKERLLTSFERDYLAALLKKTGGNISQAAREADIDRKYFRKLMRKYGLAGDDSLA